MLTDASDRFSSRLSMRLTVFFGGVRIEVNKLQNRQSQSWFGPPDTALHRHVLQLELYDASPWLFSVNSALSRTSILPSCLMSQQSLPSQPPPPTCLYNPSTVSCRYTAYIFVYLWRKGEIAVCFTKQKLHLLFIGAISPETLCRKERWSILLSRVFTLMLWLYVRRYPAHGWAHLKCWPGTFLFKVMTFLWLIRQPPAMKIALRQGAVYPSLFNGSQATLSFWWFGQEPTGGLNAFCLTSKPVSDNEYRGFIDNDTLFCREENLTVKTVCDRDV